MVTHKQLIADYKEDIRKYASGIDQTRIINLFNRVAPQLARENKKFQISKVASGARFRDYRGCAEWLVDAGMVNICYNMEFPELPLGGNYDPDTFKLYFADTGLLVSMLDDESKEDLRANRNLGVYKGALYENMVGEALIKRGYKLFYYKKADSTLEEDFFIRSAASLIPVEVKAKGGRAKSMKTLIASDHYPDIRYGIKFSKNNIGHEECIYTFPYFCAFLLKRFMDGFMQKKRTVLFDTRIIFNLIISTVFIKKRFLFSSVLNIINTGGNDKNKEEIMGTNFNPINDSFEHTVRSKIYVDKTGLIEKMNEVICTDTNCVALSHARRFGKSQAARMLRAYYSRGCDSKELFSRFEIAKAADFEEHLNKYNVIHIDVASVADFHKEDLVTELCKRLKEDFYEVYHDELNYDKDVYILINEIYKKTAIPFVIIIDEWDCVIRNHSDRPDLVHEYLQFLHSLFKSEESKSFLALGYITGILPIKKIENESALNNFTEYTMVNSKRLTPYYGFTEEEVKNLCAEYNMDFDSVKKWYDGYHINGEHMYNPNSVYHAMVDGSLESYWKNTSAYSYINKLITLNFDGLKDDVLKMLAGEKVPVNVLTFKNDLTQINSKDDALTALIHLGYLGYEEEEEAAYIPNYEVSIAYQLALETGNWKEIAESIKKCNDLLRATIAKDAETVAELLELAHETYTSIQKYNDENSLSCVVTMAYFTAPAYYNIIREMPTGKGFADFVFIPRKEAGSRPAMIVELKYDKCAETAIKQIKEKRYEGALKGYEKEILLVGISYDKDTKKHECVIEVVDCHGR